MITCPKCTKENQDHYKFCLGCGAELPRDAAPKPFAPRTPPHGIKAVQADSTAQGPKSVVAKSTAPVARPASPRPASSSPAASKAPAPRSVAPSTAAAAPPSTTADGKPTVKCPQCDHVNSVAFKFCASCGYNLTKLAAASSTPSASVAANWKLTVLRADGSDAGTYDIPPGDSVVGRDTGGIFEGDSYLSPKHAKLSTRGAKLFVEDANSLNGTYTKLKRDASEALSDGQLFRSGQEIIRFEKLHPEPPVDDVVKMGSPSDGYVGRIVLITGRTTDGTAFPIPESGIHIGRERGHILFPEDGYVSGLHCALTMENGQLSLTDLGSSNGTFVRLMDEREVMDGDILLMGQQLFRANH